MKKLLLLTLFSSMLFVAGCSKDDDDPVGPGNGGPTTISGKIDNWSLGTGKTISLGISYSSTQSYGTAAIAEDGSFTIQAQAPPAAAPLLNGVWNDPECDGSVTVSPTGANFMFGYLYVLEGENVIGYVEKEIDTEDLYCISLFFYASKDVNVTGSEACSGGSVTNYNMNFKAGWNLLYEVDEYTSTQTIENVTTTEPAGAKYMYHGTGS